MLSYDQELRRQAQQWSTLRSRIFGTYVSQWWAISYAAQPTWRREREGEGHQPSAIEAQAEQHTIELMIERGTLQ